MHLEKRILEMEIMTDHVHLLIDAEPKKGIYRTIKIPEKLYKRLKLIIKNTGFSSVTEFIVFTMRSIVSGGKISKRANRT